MHQTVVPMSPRQKFYLVAAFSTAFGFVVGCLMIYLQSKVMAGVFIGWIFVSSYLMYRVRCPDCGASVAYKGEIVGISICAGFANRRCQMCGHDLTGRSK